MSRYKKLLINSIIITEEYPDESEYHETYDTKFDYKQKCNVGEFICLI
jgi:hypothetical protein